MSTVFIDQTTNFDGSGAPVTSTNGTTGFSLAGTLDGARLYFKVRYDTTVGVGYAPLKVMINGSLQKFVVDEEGTFTLDMPPGAQWYAVLENAGASTNLDLAYAEYA